MRGNGIGRRKKGLPINAQRGRATKQASSAWTSRYENRPKIPAVGRAGGRRAGQIATIHTRASVGFCGIKKPDSGNRGLARGYCSAAHCHNRSWVEESYLPVQKYLATSLVCHCERCSGCVVIAQVQVVSTGPPQPYRVSPRPACKNHSAQGYCTRLYKCVQIIRYSLLLVCF